eukprot:608087-Rhodomonas_salina.2
MVERRRERGGERGHMLCQYRAARIGGVGAYTPKYSTRNRSFSTFVPGMWFLVFDFGVAAAPGLLCSALRSTTGLPSAPTRRALSLVVAAQRFSSSTSVCVLNRWRSFERPRVTTIRWASTGQGRRTSSTHTHTHTHTNTHIQTHKHTNTHKYTNKTTKTKTKKVHARGPGTADKALKRRLPQHHRHPALELFVRSGRRRRILDRDSRHEREHVSRELLRPARDGCLHDVPGRPAHRRYTSTPPM